MTEREFDDMIMSHEYYILSYITRFYFSSTPSRCYSWKFKWELPMVVPKAFVSKHLYVQCNFVININPVTPSIFYFCTCRSISCYKLDASVLNPLDFSNSYWCKAILLFNFYYSTFIFISETNLIFCLVHVCIVLLDIYIIFSNAIFSDSYCIRSFSSFIFI